MAPSKAQFKSVSGLTPGIPTEVYTVPSGFYALVLNAQATNTNSSIASNFTLSHKRGIDSIPLAYDYEIPPKEILYVSGGAAGNIVLEAGDSVEIVGSNDVAYSISVMEAPL